MKYSVFYLLLIIMACKNEKMVQKLSYEDQIGDTPFNSNLDDSNFKFCDSLNVLHKRALITYKGGLGALENELIKNYNFKTEYSTFNGYFVIRFAVNCRDEAGRFRMEILDPEFRLVKPPKLLENHILEIVKNLKHWQHASFEGKNYDGYKFITLKMEKGKLIKT